MRLARCRVWPHDPVFTPSPSTANTNRSSIISGVSSSEGSSSTMISQRSIPLAKKALM
jgi:hypothetical protein